MITDRLRLEAGLMSSQERLRYVCELLADHVQTMTPSVARDTTECALRLLRRVLREDLRNT